MWENVIKIEVLTALQMGVIQPSQVKEKLARKVLPGSDIEPLAEEILLEYNMRKNLAKQGFFFIIPIQL